MSEWTWTGRTRYRQAKEAWGKLVLVLQVEERGLVTYCSGGMIDSEWTNRWRDARLEDMQFPEPFTDDAPPNQKEAKE